MAIEPGDLRGSPELILSRLSSFLGVSPKTRRTPQDQPDYSNIEVEDQRWVRQLLNRVEDPLSTPQERQRINDFLAYFGANKYFEGYLNRANANKTFEKKPKEIDIHHPFGRRPSSRPLSSIDPNWAIAIDDAYRRVQQQYSENQNGTSK